MNSPSPMIASFALGTMYEVEKSWNNTFFIYSVLTFITLAFIAYNMMMYFVGREKLFLYYCLYTGGFLLVILARWSYLIEFLGLSSNFLYALYSIGVCIGIIGIVYFTTELLDISKDKNTKKFYYAVFAFIVLHLTYSYLKNEIIMYAWLLFATFVVMWLIQIAVKQLLAGHKLALLYLTSSGIGIILMVGSVFLTLYLKLWSCNEWSMNTALVAIVWDSISLSLVLSYRFKVLQHEREMAIKTIAQKERFTIIGETLANVAHQWRQPISEVSAILTNMQVKSTYASLPKDELDSSLLRANNLLSHMSQTLNTFQQFFHKSHYDHFDITRVMYNTLTFIDKKLSSSHIFVNTNISTESNIMVHGDSNEFFEVLLIILNNAYDALVENNPHNPKIDIEVMVFGDNVMISISDNAGGIKSNNLETIFEPYVSSKGLNGMGIGLFTAKSIIEKMGGTIKAENTNDGARFTINLDS